MTTRPVVFLSHSDGDASFMGRLKMLLERVTEERIEFFLSSDDVSIPPGEFVGYARLDSGAWEASNLVWRRHA